MGIRVGLRLVPDGAILFKSQLLGLLLIAHHLELVHLLQLGDLEGAVGLAGLHLEVVDLHVPLLNGVFHVELLAEHGAALVVQLLHEGGQVVLQAGYESNPGCFVKQIRTRFF